jgi:hypothetical protein
MEVMNYVNTYLMVALCDKTIKVNIALKLMVLLATCSYIKIIWSLHDRDCFDQFYYVDQDY